MPPSTTSPGPFGQIGPAVAASDSPEAGYAVGVHTRQVGADLAVPGSAALIYAEWARLVAGAEPADGQVRSLEDDGFLVTVDEQVALRDIQLDGAGKATDVRECLPGNRCPFISDVLQPDSECEPAIGCATVDSASGTLRAIHVATLLNRRPSVYYVYQLRTEREITAILEPGGSAKWDGKSDYLVLSFGGLPPAYSTETLTVSYADGGTDQLIMSFEIPLSASTTTTAS
jgi:hypothetical protein